MKLFWFTASAEWPSSHKCDAAQCNSELHAAEVLYQAGSGVATDEREKKVRRRSSLSLEDVPSSRSLYKNLIDLVGDRWTANVIALSFHGLTRFDQFHQELPIATNILAHRLKLLVEDAGLQAVSLLRSPRSLRVHADGKR